MKKCRSITGAFTTVLLVTSAMAVAADLASLKSEYDQLQEKANATYDTGMQNSLLLYSNALVTAEGQLKREGNLEDLLAVRKEKERFGISEDIPKPTPADVPCPQIQQARAAHFSRIEQAERTRDKNLAVIAKQYLAQFDALKKQLTSQDMINDALRVQAEMKKVEASLFSLPSQALVLWMRFDEDKGDLAACGKSRQPAMQLYGATWASGKFGNALNLDGKDDYAIMREDIRSAFPNESVTLSAWIFPYAAGVVITELGSTTLSTSWHDSQIEVLSDGEVKVRVWMLNPVSLGKAKMKTWNHVALRYDLAAQNLDGFLNGVEAEGDTKGLRSTPWKEGFNLYYALGAHDSQHLGGGGFFKGLIDDVRIYHRSLSATEIQVLARNDIGKEMKKVEASLSSLPSQTPVSSPLAKAKNPLKDITPTLSGGTKQASGIMLANSRVTSKDSYAPPLEIEYVCKTDSTNIRLVYGCDQLIFNWEVNLDELRIDGGPVHQQNRMGAGRVPVNKFITIRQSVEKDKMEIFVDDELRASWQADFSNINSPISVFSAHGSKVTVKSISVRVGKEIEERMKQAYEEFMKKNPKDYTQLLNAFDEWTTQSGDWSYDKKTKAIIGRGDSSLLSKHQIPSNAKVEFKINVKDGMRPRVWFQELNFEFANEGFDKIFSIFGDGFKADAQATIPYSNNIEYKIAITLLKDQIEIKVDDKLLMKGKRTTIQPFTLRLQGGDGWSRGTTVFSDFRIKVLE